MLKLLTSTLSGVDLIGFIFMFSVCRTRQLVAHCRTESLLGLLQGLVVPCAAEEWQQPEF
jgi:hypothetical protein